MNMHVHANVRARSRTHVRVKKKLRHTDACFCYTVLKNNNSSSITTATLETPLETFCYGRGYKPRAPADVAPSTKLERRADADSRREVEEEEAHVAVSHLAASDKRMNSSVKLEETASRSGRSGRSSHSSQRARIR